MWPEGPMRAEGGFGKGQCSGPPHQLGGLGEWGRAVPTPLLPPKKSRICTNPVAMPVDGRGGGTCPLCPLPPRGYAVYTIHQ